MVYLVLIHNALEQEQPGGGMGAYQDVIPTLAGVHWEEEAGAHPHCRERSFIYRGLSWGEDERVGRAKKTNHEHG